MRVAAAGRPEGPGRTRLAVACHAVDHARRAPLAIVLVGLTSVSSRVDDDAVVAVAVGNIDASPRAGDRIRQRIHGDVRRFVQQGVTGIEVVGLAARAERIGVSRWLRAVTHSLGADLRHKGRTGALRVGGHRVVFLNDAVAVSADPDVTLVIDIAAMRAVRHIGGIPIIRPRLDQAGVAPPGYDIAVGIECDDRGRRDRPPAVASFPLMAPNSFPCRTPLTVTPTSHPRLKV